MNRKAMGVGQVFIFIVAAITFGLIMIFGYRAISSFLEDAGTVEFVQFKNELEGSIKRIYTEFGAVQFQSYRAPNKYEQVCFVNLDAPYDATLCEKDRIACNEWKRSWEEARTENDVELKGYANSDENVFLRPFDPAAPKIKVYVIGMPAGDPGYLCLPVFDGEFSLRLEGRGDKTLISRVEQ